MPDTRKGYKVPATVIPGHDSFPVVDSNDVAGNLMYFDTVEQLVTIPKDKRKLGMFAYVNTEGKHYKLVDNKDVLDSACWEPYELVSKEYVDSAIASAGGGSTTPVDAYTKAESDNKYALKTEIPTVPDVSDFETVTHAEATYVTKAELENITTSIPKVTNAEFTIPENPTYPLTFEIEIPEGTSAVQVTAVAEVEETTGSNDPIVGVDFSTNPITGNGLTTNEFGIALAGSATPTAADFITYGE
jgi:hypothetical protein